jgi:Cu/Ag efflux protein CusF
MFRRQLTHYLPHTIHLHGTTQDNTMDGVPHMTQEEVPPGEAFTYRFVAGKPGTFWYHALNVVGPKVASGSFVTPDQDMTLFLHCHLPAHDKVGMVGKLIVGKGGEMKTISQMGVPSSVAKSFQGIGTVVAALPRAGRLIVNHDEIQGFMAAMEMSYVVLPPSLLNRLNAGDRIRFTLDAAKSAVTSIEVIDSAK